MNSDVFSEILKNNPQLKVISDTSDNSKKVVVSKPEKTTQKPQNIGKVKRLPSWVGKDTDKPSVSQNKRHTIVYMDYPGCYISEDHCYNRNGKKTFMKPEAREWQEELILKLNQAGVSDYKLPISVTLTGNFKNERESIDIHNLKIVYDSIQKVTGINDRKFETHTYPGEIVKDSRPQIIIKIEEV
jgi:hypothetical protein